MGGLYGDEFDFPEWNIVQDLKSSQMVFEKWPTKIIASGWELGNKLLYPHQSILNDFSPNHPLSVSYKIYDKMPYDRQTWDLTSVLHAVEPDSNYFDLSPKGTIKIDSTGKSIFRANENGKHQYMKVKSGEEKRALDAMVNQVVGKNPADY